MWRRPRPKRADVPTLIDTDDLGHEFVASVVRACLHRSSPRPPRAILLNLGARASSRGSRSLYSSTAAVIAQNNAAVQNDAMISAMSKRARRNMATLEQSVVKDNTLMPVEWYGGQLHLAPSADQAGGQKSLYDRHHSRDRSTRH